MVGVWLGIGVVVGIMVCSGVFVSVDEGDGVVGTIMEDFCKTVEVIKVLVSEDVTTIVAAGAGVEQPAIINTRMIDNQGLKK